MSVKPKRHLVKAITWRIIASATTFIIGWIVTGDMQFGIAIGAVDVLIKIVLYYFHERLWYQSKFGIIKDDHQSLIKPIFINEPRPTLQKIKVLMKRNKKL